MTAAMTTGDVRLKSQLGARRRHELVPLSLDLFVTPCPVIRLAFATNRHLGQLSAKSYDGEIQWDAQ